jgi:hypothetical protein
MPGAKAHNFSESFSERSPTKCVGTQKARKRSSPRMNAGAPTERQRRRPEASGTNYKIQIPTEKQVNPIPLFAKSAKD